MARRNNFYLILTLTIIFSLMAVAPPQIFSQTSKGIELYGAWNFQEAEKVLRDAVKSNPGDVSASYYLGLSVLLQDKHSEALEILQKVKEAQDRSGQGKAAMPDEFQIQVALARAHLELKQYPEAWKNLEAARKERANAAEVYVYRGFYYLQQENLKQALKELNKAIDLDAQNAYAHYYAGQAYIRQGNPARAVEMFKEFLQLAPLAPEAVKAKALIDALC